MRAMVHRDDQRAQQLRVLGADVVVGDLTRAADIVDALAGVRRMPRRAVRRSTRAAITAEDLSLDDGRRLVESVGLPEHVTQHIATMARLHREDRYNRSTDDVARILGRPAQTVAQYVTQHSSV
ncbi:MAG: hypothetical protein ACXWEI_12215 [Mycobacterium sp.]